MDRSVFTAIQRVGSIFILRFYMVHVNFDTLFAKTVVGSYDRLDDSMEIRLDRSALPPSTIIKPASLTTMLS